MKTIKFIFICFFVFLTTTPVFTQNRAQSTDTMNDMTEDIISAFQNGDSKVINEYLNSNIELIIADKNDVFSKPQASVIITNFFKVNKVSSFQLLHKGKKESASFIIGSLKTNINSYRVYVLTRTPESKTVIQQLRIEPTNE
jgi:hypothetical protein